MKLLALIFAVTVCKALAVPRRAKREAYALPDGADIIVGAIKTTFQCPPDDGYYADMDNNCQIFHVCHTNSEVPTQYSFMCGNQTVFNQYSLSCSMEEDSIPCSDSASFFYTNARLWNDDPKQYFLDDDDVARAAQVIPSMLYRGAAGIANAVGSAVGAGAGRGRGK